MSSNKRNGELIDSGDAKRAKSNGTTIGTNHPAKPVSEALKAAIETARLDRMKPVILSLCETNPQLVEQLSQVWLVKGKVVVPYHADTESEDEGKVSDEDGEESEGDGKEDGDESEQDEEDSDNEIERLKKPKNVMKTGGKVASEVPKGIAVGNEEFTARYATCMNCDEEFDVTDNERGMCRWHADLKEVDHDWIYWGDQDIEGSYKDYENDPDLQEGFIWLCCKKDGSHEGCLSTKHKTDANQVLS